MIETAPDVWSVGDLNEFDCWHTGLLAECISASGVGVVGFILPPQVGGRRISQHVVMQEGDAFVPYDSIQDVQARHGELVVGHLWGPPGKDGYRTCSRCQCRWRPGLE
ncbi:MAG: hypothetical protein VX899_25490 [Myxococcota bacterium]|nr:hypothetical protein [Myxococcota bacterium]